MVFPSAKFTFALATIDRNTQNPMLIFPRKLFFTGLLFLTALPATAQSKADSICERADILIGQGRLQEAMQELNKVLSIAPGYAKAYANKAAIECTFGDTVSAMRDFDLAILYNPADAGPYRNRALVYQQQKNYADALKDVDKIIALKVTNASVYSMRATLLGALHRYKECMLDYDKALKLDPLWDTAYVLKARSIVYELDDYDKAVAVLDQCLVKCPKSIYALEYRVIFNIYRDKYQDIINDLDVLKILAPGNSANYYYHTGMAKAKLGDKKSACEDMDKSRVLGLGEAFLYMFDNCREITTSTDFKADVLGYEADKLYEKAMYDAAIAKLSEAIILQPEDAVFYYQRGRVKFKKQDYALALEDMTAALKIKSGDPEILMMYGQCKMYLEDYVTAKEYMRKAIAAKPAEVLFYQQLALLCMDTKDFTPARESLETAMRLDPNRAELYLLMGENYMLQNDKEKACENFNKAKTLGDGRAYVKVILNCK